MPVTITLKNIPDDVYKRLKLSADTHRRSLNGEAIVCLEAVLLMVAAKMPAFWLLALAAVSQLLGLFAERWLFFAQANHPQSIYHQAVAQVRIGRSGARTSGFSSFSMRMSGANAHVSTGM